MSFSKGRRSGLIAMIFCSKSSKPWSGLSTIQDALLNKSSDLLSKASWIGDSPLRDFESKFTSFTKTQSLYYYKRTSLAGAIFNWFASNFLFSKSSGHCSTFLLCKIGQHFNFKANFKNFVPQFSTDFAKIWYGPSFGITYVWSSG